MKPHLIMPMGGAGSRFQKNGYTIPKPLIEIQGKPFFYWAAMSIYKFIDVEDIIFVVLKEHVEKFVIDKKIKEFFPKAEIITIPNILPGPVYTSMAGVENINDDTPVIFNDCDHMFRCENLEALMQKEKLEADGILLTFESNKDCYSYVKYDENKIVGTVEKKVVSNHAICGAYVFKNKYTFLDSAKKYILNCPYNESFMSGVYNILCDNHKSVIDYLLDFHVEFGTPEEYKEAQTSKYFSVF